MKFIDENSLNRLNFKDLLARVDVFSAYGKNKLNNLENFLVGEEEKLEEEFERMQKIYDFISENKKEEMEIEIVLHRFKDIKKLVENADAGIILDTVDIFEIKAQLMAMVDLNSYLLKNKEVFSNFVLKDMNELFKILDPNDEKIATFYIYEAYSVILKEIRRQKKEVENRLFNETDYEIVKRLKDERLSILVDEEKEEFDYFYKNEKNKFFVAKLIEGKISVNENEVTEIYTKNKANFDAQNIPFSQAKEIIQRDLLNQQVATLEAEELDKLVQEMEDKVEITKEEILFSKGNSEVLKTLIVGKIIAKKMEEKDFEEKNKKDLEIVKDNVYINYYLDLQVRKNVKVTQEEITEIYEREKAKLGNVTPNSAYQQIANGLLNNKAVQERNNLIDQIAKDYNVEEVAKEYIK